MGVESYLVTSSPVAVLAQRLARVIMMETFRGAGREECHGRGYTSRVGIFEMMDGVDARRRWRKIQTGLTTVQEVPRVTPEI